MFSALLSTFTIKHLVYLLQKVLSHVSRTFFDEIMKTRLFLSFIDDFDLSFKFLPKTPRKPEKMKNVIIVVKDIIKIT